MSDTLDDALESLRREAFYRGMAEAEATLRSDENGWARYTSERAQWLSADLAQT